MASYSSYKKIVAGDSLAANVVTDVAMAAGTRKQYGVKWFFGEPCVCSSGCCCAWTVPNNVYQLQIEAWGGGGGGHGACSCSRCHHYQGAGGGYYNSTKIDTVPGCAYIICAAGTVTCCSLECIAQNGCASYVTGFNLSNFCAIGGSPGCANGDWTTACNSEWSCCIQSGANGGTFGFGNHRGNFGSTRFRYDVGFCHCYHTFTHSTSAPLINTNVYYNQGYCWMRCGCWTVPYGHGGQGAMSTYCGSGCCGTGGHGGPGLVKITFF
jgi:hypothetical protein